MAKTPKSKGQGPAKPSGAADAARRRAVAASKTKYSFPWQLSLLVLLVAVGVTVLLTRSPPQAVKTVPKPPKVEDPESAGAEGTGKASFQDKHFAPQNRKAQCESWAADKECENNVRTAAGAL